MNYPKAIKAFCMRLNDDGCTVAAMDVCAPGIGEVIGGSQREERLDVLDRSMAKRGIDREHYAWYRDLRRYGCRTPASASASSPPSPTSPASRTRDAIPSREPPATRGIEARTTLPIRIYGKRVRPRTS